MPLLSLSPANIIPSASICLVCVWSKPNMTLASVLLLFICCFHSFASAIPVWHRIAKRYVLHSQRWNKCRLTWAFRDPFRLFPSDEQFFRTKKVIAEAMRHWEHAGTDSNNLRLTDLSPAGRSSLLNIRRVADIDIFFAGFAHGDAENFDGRGGLVAHSAYPRAGIVHFDASERWALDGKAKVLATSKTEDFTSSNEWQPVLDLRYVALHEIGHALGLRHSTFRNSVMNRYYREQLDMEGQGKVVKLSKDDIAAIEELFGENCKK